ncbi:hypothetical protein ATCC90586_004114 [Pythium insidiosum]|nr:hypothetical protein ATCC90586_004114 [Pythium insidiosum]
MESQLEHHSVSAVAVIDLGDSADGDGDGDDPHAPFSSSVVVIGGGSDSSVTGSAGTDPVVAVPTGHVDEEDDDDDVDVDADADAGGGCGPDCGHSHGHDALLYGHAAVAMSSLSSRSSAMAPLSYSEGGKRKRVVLSIHDKQQVLQRLDLGEAPVAIARDFNISRQQVSDIKKNRERILAFCVDAKHFSTLRRKTLTATTDYHPGVEQELYRWLIRQRTLGRAVTSEALSHKTTDLFMQYSADDSANLSMRAITVWLRHFKRAHGLKTLSDDEIANLPAKFTPSMEMVANSSSASTSAPPPPPSTASSSASPTVGALSMPVDDVSAFMSGVSPNAHTLTAQLQLHQQQQQQQQYHQQQQQQQFFLLNHVPPPSETANPTVSHMLPLSSMHLGATSGVSTTDAAPPATTEPAIGMAAAPHDPTGSGQATAMGENVLQTSVALLQQMERFERDVGAKLDALESRLVKTLLHQRLSVRDSALC